jgi:hypothetical protein
VERSLETQVSQAVDAWLRWLPRWEPATHRGRVAPCRRCFGSPVLSAAGLGADVPHGVQHGLSTRIKTIVDHAVAEYTALNLPMLQAELDQQAARNRARSYRPGEGLEPEFEGLPLDPEPTPGAPFLFTLTGLAAQADSDVPELPPLTEEAKAALRQGWGSPTTTPTWSGARSAPSCSIIDFASRPGSPSTSSPRSRPCSTNSPDRSTPRSIPTIRIRCPDPGGRR